VISITYSNGLLRYKGSNLIISGITIASGNTANFAQTHNCPIGGAGFGERKLHSERDLHADS
jgi:hypothetical protein